MILDTYCSASRKMVSVDNSSLFFSPSTNVDMRAQVCSMLQIMIEALNDKYLVLYASLEANKSDGFQYLVDRLIPKLGGWKVRCFSSGAKKL